MKPNTGEIDKKIKELEATFLKGFNPMWLEVIKNFRIALQSSYQLGKEEGKKEGVREYLIDLLSQYERNRLEGNRLDFYFVLNNDLDELNKAKNPNAQ